VLEIRQIVRVQILEVVRTIEMLSSFGVPPVLAEE
jgi:hypothetical protein